MPVSLLPSRRRFLQTAAGATLAAPWIETRAKPAGKWVALLADTHIDANPETVARDVVMAENLRKVVAEILAESTSPEFAVINGDCAYLKGLKGDYETLRPLITPLLDAGIPVHLTMGNHDDRRPFYQLFPEAENEESPEVGGKHMCVIESADVNWYLLDSLQIVNNVTGEIGRAQRNWLEKEIKARGDKPAIVVGHHYLERQPVTEGKKITGLADTADFVKLLDSTPQIQAYIYGHSHSYGFDKTEGGVNLINQPPVAYLFDKAKPNGWIRVEMVESGLTLNLRALDKQHKNHDDITVINWR